MKKVASNICFGGDQQRYLHRSETLGCEMHFSIFLPERLTANANFPVVYWLSGLTCTDENFVQKAGAQRLASQFGLVIVCPDTSPRGDAVPDDENGAYDFGLGAGFYVNATQEPWRKHYQMEDYLIRELIPLIGANFPVDKSRQSIFGHSMGGHGALTLALKNPQLFKSVSAFAPIVSPKNCPWGQKALSGYLGEDMAAWDAYDACELVKSAGDRETKLPILIDQGSADQFLTEQLKPELFQQACEAAAWPLQFNLREAYDHSYFFIASFIADHLDFHAKALSQ